MTKYREILRLRSLEFSQQEEIKALDVRIVELDQDLMEMYEGYREEKITREEYLNQKEELEKMGNELKGKILSLEDHLVNGLELQVKDATGLEVKLKTIFKI